MRILHVVPTYLPAVRYGGPMFSIHALCRSLAAMGHEVHVATTSLDGPDDLDVALGTPVDRDGVAVWYFPVTPPRRIARSPALGRHLRERMHAFDVLHTHAMFQWPPWRAAREARRAGVPYVMAPRGMLVPELFASRRPLAKALWLRLLDHGNLTQAAALHLTSERERDDVARLGLAVDRAVVIPNGFDMDDALAPSAAAPPAQPYALYLGRISWKKGLDRFIRALAQAREVQAIIAGNDDEGYRRTLEGLARECGVRDRVRFLEPVYGAEKWALLRAAAFAVLPSQSENFGNAVLEAMAAGKPVVVSDAVGLAEAVREADCGIVTGNEPGMLAAALERLWRDPDARREMGERGRRLVQSEYAWPRIAARTAELYAGLAR
jgi:glycosyltransferase involved in cell wall biosynthesis